LLTHRQTDRQTKSGKNITSLAEVMMVSYVCDGQAYWRASREEFAQS